MMSNQWQLCTLFLVFLFVWPGTSNWISTNDACVGIPEGQKPQIQGNASVALDEILSSVSRYLKKINATQISLPNQSANFSFLVFKGHIDMFNGFITGFDEMQRFGDAQMQYLNKGTTVSAAVRFKDPSFFYEMQSKVINYARSGTIRASLARLSMRINISVNLTSLCKKIDRVEIENLDSIKVKVDSGWILDSLTSTISNTVIWIYKNRIVPVWEKMIADNVQKYLDKFHLDDLLRPHNRTAALPSMEIPIENSEKPAQLHINKEIKT